MKQVNLQDVGLTDRYNRNRAQSNFKEIEDAVNSNAITAEEMYAELNGKLAAEANARKAGDDSEAQTRAETDEELEGKITTEANERKAGDDSEARDRQAADEVLEQELRSEMVAEDKNLQSQIDDKASIEDLNNAKAEWLARAKHIALGTDFETVEAAVVMVLHKRGVI